MPAETRVWYVSYGSNMLAARLMCYLAGGVPDGATHCYAGCRDATPPSATRACELPGGVYFATESAVWGGGRAFYDPALPGPTPARAYLLTADQFADVAAQEMYRAPGPALDLGNVLSSGVLGSGVLGNGRVQFGPGRYETLLHLGDHDGHPALTFTAPWSAAEVEHTPPSAAYLRTMVAGLREAHGWSVRRAADHLTGLPGAAGTWTPAMAAELC